MGYTTDFFGRFDFDKPVSKEFAEYINRFSNTRRMMRDPKKIKAIYPDWKDFCFNSELGKNGEYFAHDESFYDESIIDYNKPPETQPGLWCQWIITDDLQHLEWDGGEKFYEYDKWLEYLINNFIKPSGYILNGSVDWQGEDEDDSGTLFLTNNELLVKF